MINKILFSSIFFLLILKISAISLTSFSLYGDEAQYWLWSQKPDLGYFSKPPLLAWFLFGYIGLFGDSFISLKTFPIVIYLFITFSIYRLCICLSFDKNSAWLCAISFLIIPAASLSSFLISTDLLLILFWVISMVSLLNIINYHSTYNFFLLGLFLGLAFLAKYAAIYFLISIFLLLIIDKKTQNIFKKNPLGVFIFLLSFFLVLAPNIFWNFKNAWITFYHTSSNANLENLSLSVSGPLWFLGAQILMVSPFLFCCFIFFYKSFHLDFINKFLLTFSLPALFIILTESFLVRANANWAAPALISVFILLFRTIYEKKIILIKINFIFNYVIAVFLFVSILVSTNNKVFDRIKGIDKFVDEISILIEDNDLVVSDRIIFSNVSYQMREKSNKILMPYKKNTVITNHFQISAPLINNQKNDFFLLGNLGDTSYVSKKHFEKLIKEFDVPFSQRKLSLYEINFK